MGIGVNTSIEITTRRQRRAKMGIVFVLTSTGDGSGASTLTMESSENTLITLDGAGKFYSDAGGTADESATWLCTTGGSRTIYLKVTSGTSNMTISGDTITEWSTWTSAANAASLSGDITQLTAATVLTMWGTNALTGNVANLSNIEWLGMSSNNALSGDISGLTTLVYMSLSGSNTIYGDLKNVSSGLTLCSIEGDNQIVDYTSGGDWSSINDSGTITINPDTGYGLAEAEVDLLIQEIESTRTAGRAIDVTLQGSNAARSAASDAAVAALIADGGSVTTN